MIAKWVKSLAETTYKVLIFLMILDIANQMGVISNYPAMYWIGLLSIFFWSLFSFVENE